MSQADAWRVRSALIQRRNVNQAYRDGYRVTRNRFGQLTRVPMPDIGRMPEHTEGLGSLNLWRRGWQFAKDYVKTDALLGATGYVRDRVREYSDRGAPRSGVVRKRSRSVDRYEGFDPDVSYGTYSGVVWRPGGAVRWDRGPKRWDDPDMPWPTSAAAADAGGGSVSRKGKSHFNSKVSYTRT